MSRKEEILEELNDALRERTPVQGDALRAALREHRQAAPPPRAIPWRVALSTGLTLASVAGISLLSRPTSLVTARHPSPQPPHLPLKASLVGGKEGGARGGFSPLPSRRGTRKNGEGRGRGRDAKFRFIPSPLLRSRPTLRRS